MMGMNSINFDEIGPCKVNRQMLKPDILELPYSVIMINGDMLVILRYNTANYLSRVFLNVQI